MIKIPQLQRAEIFFIVEPVEEKRRDFLRGWFARTAQVNHSRRFQFERAGHSEAMEADVPFLNIKKYYFNPDDENARYGLRWLEWGEAIKDWKEKAVIAAVDSFDDLMTDFDSLVNIDIRSNQKGFSQMNSERFFHLTNIEHSARVIYLLGVSHFEWVTAFLGYGELRQQQSFIARDFFNLKTEVKKNVVPTPRFRNSMNDYGLYSLRFSQNLSLLFLSKEGFDETNSSNFRELRAPSPPEIPGGEFLLYSPVPNSWRTATLDTILKL